MHTIDAIKDPLERLLKLLHLNAKVVEVENAYLEEEDLGKGIEIDGWIYVYPVKIVADTETGRKIPSLCGWFVETLHIIRGCHTLSNGDPGYPDDADIVVQAESARVSEVVNEVIDLIIQQEKEHFWENESITQMLKEQAENAF